MMQLLDPDSRHASFDASKHVPAIAGIKPAPEATNVNVNTAVAGYVIMLGPRSSGPPDVIIGGELPAPPASDE
jgi:hypothetical protein